MIRILSFRRFATKTVSSIHKLKNDRVFQEPKTKSNSAGSVSLQVLGNGSNGTGASIFLQADQTRYLFNCGEGSQRLANEHGRSLYKIENVFLTRNTWSRFGGLLGCCLSLQAMGVSSLKLHGPSRITEIFESARRFADISNINVEGLESKAGSSWEDAVMRVNYVPLFKDNFQPDDEVSLETFRDETDYFRYDDSRQGKKSKSTQPNCPDKINLTPKVEDNVMAYICRLKERLGTLNLEKCVEKGIGPGPLLKQIKDRIDVTLPNGNVVKADDVFWPTCLGPIFIFVDIPDETFLASLVKSEAFKPHQKDAKVEEIAKIIIHFTPQNVVDHPIYKEWMQRFPKETKHLFVNERNEFSGYYSAHELQRDLHELNPITFPELQEKLPSNQNEGNRRFSDDNEISGLSIRSIFHLRPPKGLDRSMEPSKALNALTDPEIVKMIEHFKKQAKRFVAPRTSEEREKEFPKIITLGTGSSKPDKIRNSASNLVHIDNDSCILLDCGEGTLGQLIRFYGAERTDEVLKKLRCIYISHLHVDHHIGLFNILNHRRKLTNDKVLLLAPKVIEKWLSFYNYRIAEINSTFDLATCDELFAWNRNEQRKKEIWDRVGLTKISTCFVVHCSHSYGISFEMKNVRRSASFPGNTIKITYSGDTTPCQELVDIGMSSDLLIHEATFDDDRSEEAAVKRHSTISQAINAGRRMSAKLVILTHFSHRYVKVPLIKSLPKNHAIAFDNMEVTLNDLPAMHLMYEPLKVIFKRQVDMMEQKVLRKKYREERKNKRTLEY